MYIADRIKITVGKDPHKPSEEYEKVVIPSPKSEPNLTSSTLFPKVDNGEDPKAERPPFSGLFSSY